MRVLIVDGFADNPESRRSASIFKSLIREAFTHQKMYNVQDIEFIEVDRDSIDTYLYELNTGYLSRDAEKLFDHLDFVFIDGESNMLPWLRKARKFLTLVRMCKRTNKIMFACTFAMQMLVYLCATNYNIDRVINGKGKGSSIAEINKIPKETLNKLTLGDAFLDSSTGDIYCHDPHRGEFYPVSNAGIHNHKAAQENEKVSKAMIKSHQYWAKNFDSPDDVYIGKSSETKCRIFKQYVQHWLLKGLGFNEFLVPSLNQWDVHPVNATIKGNVYTVFAESSRGPQIIVHRNAVGVQFHLNPKYQATFTVLKNFVIHMMSRFQNETAKLDLPLSIVTKAGVGISSSMGAVSRFSSDNGTLMNSQSTMDMNNTYGLRANEAKHSGFAFSLRGGEPLTVKINATTSEAIKLEGGSPFGLRPKTSNIDSFESHNSSEVSIYSHHSIKRKNTNKKVGFAKKDSVTTRENPILDDRIIKPIQSEYINTLGADFIESLPTAWKSKKEIRSFLHPGYDIGNMPKKGNIMNGKNLTLARNDFEYYEKPLVKIVMSPRPYCRYNKEFKGTETETFQKTRTSSFANLGNTIRNDGSPFIEPDKRKIQEEIKDKEKWVAKSDFSRVFSASQTIRPVGYNSPSTPYFEHKFRDEDKAKWIYGAFKTASY